MDKKEIKWDPRVCAVDSFPVMVFGGILTYPKEGGMHIEPDYRINNPWGTPDRSSMGRYSSSIPDGLGIKWYSYAENKFYSDFFDLDADSLKHLFSQSLVGSDTKRIVSYKHIVVGMAPHGIVNVWLVGDGYSTEIGSFKATEVEMDIGEFSSDLARYYADWEDREAALSDLRLDMAESEPGLLERIQSNTPIPEGLWDKKYREKFDFRVRLNLADPMAIADMMTMEFINGEAETLVYEGMKENASKKRARIKKLTYMWSYGRELRNSKINLDTEEILEAYRLIYENEPQDMLCELRVDLNEDNTHSRVYLQAVGTEYPKEVELLKSYITIYPIDEFYRYIFDVFRDEYEDSYEDRMLRKDR